MGLLLLVHACTRSALRGLLCALSGTAVAERRLLMRRLRHIQPLSWVTHKPWPPHLAGMPEADVLLFLASPRLSSLEEMEQRGLFLSDFSLHDMGSDYVLLAEQRQAEAGLKERYEKLSVELKVWRGTEGLDGRSLGAAPLRLPANRTATLRGLLHARRLDAYMRA